MVASVPNQKAKGTANKRSMAEVQAYLDSNKFNDHVKEDSDEEDLKNPEVVGKTPNTRKRLLHEKEVASIEKLGPMATVFTLFKGIVASGVLYLPTSFVNGGSLFSAFALIASLLFTLYCIWLLLAVRAKLGGNLSFPEIGQACYGKTGRILVDVSLFASQVGFVCAYIYFISS